MSQPFEASEKLEELRRLVTESAHDNTAMAEVREFFKPMKSRERQGLLNLPGAILRTPITRQTALENGAITEAEDPFVLLQGDLVSSDAAYELGVRLENNPTFVDCNSTCDLVPDRRNGNTVLLGVVPVLASDANAAQTIGELLTFRSNHRLYLPRLSSDPPEVVASYVDFTRPATIDSNNLILAHRHASMGLLGWHLFATVWRSMFTRAAANESVLRLKGQR